MKNSGSAVRLCSLLILLLLLLGIDGYSQNGALPALTIRKTADFDISGKGSAKEWRKTEWINLERRQGIAEYETHAKLLYSETGIYGLFRCQDNKIIATFTEDFSDLWTEDVIEIFFWTDESTTLYFEYELSPMNVELPILVPNLKGDYLGWRPWKYEGARKTRHATHIMRDRNGNSTEWIGEFFIPYALLKPLPNVPPQSGDQWRINMYRKDYDRDYTAWSWRPVKTNFHDYERFGTVRFE